MGRKSALDQTQPKSCPDCGTVVFSMGGHRGKRTCQAWAAGRAMENRGFIELLELQRAGAPDLIPTALLRFLETAKSRYNGHHANISEEKWLPRWVALLLIEGHWTHESLRRIEQDPELQIAHSMQFDIKYGRRGHAVPW